MSRRANGEGTVFQRADGRYAASAYVPTRSGRKRRTVYGRTRDEAAGKLADLLAQARRGVPVAEKGWTVERYLRYWLAEVVEQERRPATGRLAAGPVWRDSGLVFTTATGTGIEHRNLNRHWYSLRTRAGLPSVRFHDLRHTCVTLLLDAGVPPHIVQAIAGHSGIQVTMSIYAHAAQEEQRKALRWLGERLA